MFLGTFSLPKVQESYHPKEESKKTTKKSLILQLNFFCFACVFFFADELDHLLLPLKIWLPGGGGEIP